MPLATIPAGGAIATATAPLTIVKFSADMAIDKTTSPTANALQDIDDTTELLTDHLAGGKILNALTLNVPGRSPESLYVECFWETTGSTHPTIFKCQVNFEEVGRESGAASLDINVDGRDIAFEDIKSEYKDVIKVEIGTVAGNLTPGLYTVSALFFVEVSGSTGLGAFTEVGKIMIA